MDNFLITGFGILDVLAELKKTYTITGGKMPNQHLGMSLKRHPNIQYIEIGSHQYVTNNLVKVKEILGITTLKKVKKPTPSTFESEMENSKLLDAPNVKKFQMLIGIVNWLVNIGRSDIAFAVNQLSRINAAPREGHMELAQRIFEYLHKFPNRYFHTEGKEQTHFMADLN